MLHENVITTAVARLASIPFRLFNKKPFVPPKKALILHPCCISQVMFATPLLAILGQTYSQSRFDWAVSDWARPAIAGNPRLTELISTGPSAMQKQSWGSIQQLITRLQTEQYDTCFIPSRSSLLAFIAWRAGIPQRIGLNVHGRGFAHTIPVRPPPGEAHAAAIYLSLAKAIGIHTGQSTRLPMEFYPSDSARTAVTKRLIDDLDWLGDVPLVIMHPGGGSGSVYEDKNKQWPAERFTRLGNYLIQQHNARILLIGSAHDKSLAKDIAGMMSQSVADWAGNITLSELGALGEMADLYVGNDTGPTNIATAVGCPTIAIFGPSDPTKSAPYSLESKVIVLSTNEGTKRPFTWENNVSVKDAQKAADQLLKRKNSV